MEKILFTFVFLNILLLNSAFAYLDPGTISMVLQAVVAGFVGVAFFFKRNWLMIKDKLFNKNKKSEETENNSDSNS